MAYLCYALAQRDACVHGRPALGRAATYVGCTNNFARRLRQHNGELAGGARCTSAARAAGAVWVPIALAEGFADKREALSFEWHWKAESRKLGGRDPVHRRHAALEQLLAWPRFAHVSRRGTP